MSAKAELGRRVFLGAVPGSLLQGEKPPLPIPEVEPLEAALRGEVVTFDSRGTVNFRNLGLGRSSELPGPFSGDYYPETVSMSPQGDRVAVVGSTYSKKEDKATQNVFLIGVDGQAKDIFKRVNNIGFWGSEVKWSADGDWIAIMSQDAGRVRRIENSEVVVLNTRNGAEALWGQNVGRFDFSPDHREFVYRNQSHLYVKDLAIGDKPKGWNFGVDLGGQWGHQMEVAWSADSKFLAFSDSNLHLYHREREAIERFEIKADRVVGFSPDDRYLLLFQAVAPDFKPAILDLQQRRLRALPALSLPEYSYLMDKRFDKNKADLLFISYAQQEIVGVTLDLTTSSIVRTRRIPVKQPEIIPTADDTFPSVLKPELIASDVIAYYTKNQDKLSLRVRDVATGDEVILDNYFFGTVAQDLNLSLASNYGKQ